MSILILIIYRLFKKGPFISDFIHFKIVYTDGYRQTRGVQPKSRQKHATTAGYVLYDKTFLTVIISTTLLK